MSVRGRRRLIGAVGRDVIARIRTLSESTVEIKNRDYWMKVVDFLQHNWALIDDQPGGARVWFVHDLSGVFDDMYFADRHAAEQALTRNGFERFRDLSGYSASLQPPEPPFETDQHPNGRIYSSGRLWV